MLILAERIRFFEMMARLLHAGMTTSEAMKWVARDFKKHTDAMTQVSVACGAGTTLSAALEQHQLLDKRFIVIIRQGEMSGKLTETFEELRDLSEKIEMEVSKAGRALLAPLGYLIAATAIFMGFLLHVFPTFGSGLPESSKNALFKLSDYTVSIVNQAPLLLAFGAALLVTTLVVIAINPATKRALIELSFSIPMVRDVTLGFFITMWARYAALSLNAGVSVEETFKQTKALVPDAIGDGLMLTLSEVNQKGWGHALDMDSWQDSDPRKHWPIDFCTALKIGGTSGDIGGAVYKCSESLLEISKRGLSRLSKAADLIGKLLVGAIIGLLFLALMMGQMTAIQAGM